MYTPYSHRQRLTEVPRGVNRYDTQSGVHGLYWRQSGGLCEYDTRVWGREARLLEGERGFTATQTHTGILYRQGFVDVAADAPRASLLRPYIPCTHATAGVLWGLVSEAEDRRQKREDRTEE